MLITMKKSRLIVIALAMIAMLSMASCTKENPQTATDYTIMICGCGGEDLDEEGAKMLSNCLAYGSTESVKIAFEFNFSKEFQTQKPLPGTFRMAVPEESRTYEAKPSEFITWLGSLPDAEVLVNSDNAPLKLSDQENLTDFINWASTKYPAKNYILVLWNHGNGWLYSDEVETKSLLFDDNYMYKPTLSLNILENAVKQSSVPHFKCLITDACMMCTAENYFGYRNIADFVVGSTSPASSKGGDYNMLLTLLNGLRVKGDTEFATVMRKYCDYCIQTWYDSSLAADISFTDMSRLDEVAVLFKQFVDILVKNYPDNFDDINECINSSLAVMRMKGKCYPMIDMNDFIREICENSGINFPNDFEKTIIDTINSVKYTSLTPKLIKLSTNKVGFSINLLDDVNFEKQKELYKSTAFDKATGWSRFLEINKQSLIDNPVMAEVRQ